MFVARRAYWEGYTKAMFNRTYRDGSSEEKLLGVEYNLLRRILTRLFPDILKAPFTSPTTAWRKLLVTGTALSFVATGYFTYLFQSLISRKKFVVDIGET